MRLRKIKVTVRQSSRQRHRPHTIEIDLGPREHELKAWPRLDDRTHRRWSGRSDLDFVSWVHTHDNFGNISHRFQRGTPKLEPRLTLDLGLLAPTVNRRQSH